MTTPEQPPVPAPPHQPYGLLPPASQPVSAPPGAVGTGFPPVAPYVPPQDPRYGQRLQAPSAKGSSALGITALVLALVAAVGLNGLLTVALFQVAAELGPRLADFPDAPHWGLLTPVRDWVLAGEIAVYGGAALGVAALILGIVATARRRGRGAGIAAIVISALGPMITALAALAAVLLAAGSASLAL